MTAPGSDSPPLSSSITPAASSGDDAQSNRIALGVGLGFGLGVGLPATVADIVTAYYGIKSYYKPRP